MKIKDIHPDITRYLEEDCYCQYEIYDTTGFFFKLFKPDDECKFLGKSKTNLYFAVVQKDGQNPEILAFKEQENKIIDSVRFDATENNLKSVKNTITGVSKKINIVDKFDSNTSDKDLEQLLQMSNFVIMD